MANDAGWTRLDSGARQMFVDTSALLALGPQQGMHGRTWYIKVKVGGGTPGSFVIKQRIRGTTHTGSDLTNCSYSTTASTGTMTAAGTSVTADGIYVVITDCMETFLDYTGGANGMTITVCDSNS